MALIRTVKDVILRSELETRMTEYDGRTALLFVLDGIHDIVKLSPQAGKRNTCDWHGPFHALPDEVASIESLSVVSPGHRYPYKVPEEFYRVDTVDISEWPIFCRDGGPWEYPWTISHCCDPSDMYLAGANKMSGPFYFSDPYHIFDHHGHQEQPPFPSPDVNPPRPTMDPIPPNWRPMQGAVAPPPPAFPIYEHHHIGPHHMDHHNRAHCHQCYQHLCPGTYADVVSVRPMASPWGFDQCRYRLEYYAFYNMHFDACDLDTLIPLREEYRDALVHYLSHKIYSGQMHVTDQNSLMYAQLYHDSIAEAEIFYKTRDRKGRYNIPNYQSYK